MDQAEEKLTTGKTRKLQEKAGRYLMRTKHYLEQPVLVSGRGMRLRDVDGTEYLDFNAGSMCATLGHSHPKLVAAMAKAADTFIHSSSVHLSESSIVLGEKLAAVLPKPLEVSTFLSTGSEANEVAYSVAKSYTGGFDVGSMHMGYFGRTAGVRSLNRAIDHRGHGPMLPGSHTIWGPYEYRCPICSGAGGCNYQCLDLSFEMFDSAIVGPPSAIFTEPIFNAGGIVECPPGYLLKLQQKCRDRNMLLILDEEATGMGRTGTVLASTTDGIVPDVVTLGKTLGGGVAVSAITTSRHIWETVMDRGFFHSSTHAYDPMPMVAAITVLDVLEEEQLLEQVSKNGKYLKDGLLRLQREHEVIGDVRGRGFLLGVEFVKDRASKEPAGKICEAVERQSMERGLMVARCGLAALGRNVIKIAPSFVATPADIDMALEILDATIRQVTAGGLKSDHPHSFPVRGIAPAVN